MSHLFQQKYRIPSTRFSNWNYANEGMYFITICTYQKQQYFGSITNNTMCLSELGSFAYNQWTNTPTIRPDMNIDLGEFVVMPNHFHAILTIGVNNYNHPDVEGADSTETAPFAIGNKKFNNSFSPQSNNLSSIVRGFKSVISSYAAQHHIPFKWQERFHDHIIRSYDNYARITDYVNNNITNWQNDKFYS